MKPCRLASGADSPARHTALGSWWDHPQAPAELMVLLLWVLVCQPMLSAPWYQARGVRGLSWALVAFSLALRCPGSPAGVERG